MTKGTIHMPADGVDKLLDWVEKAQIDYVDCYIKLYIAYNAWYRRVTGTTNDRQAIATLKKRFIIWDDYSSGRSLRYLRPIMKHLVELTQREPFASTSAHWNGEIANIYDWRSLVEYWYQVRCSVVHGNDTPDKYIIPAYESLNVFMHEIISRMRACLEQNKTDELKAIAEEKQLYESGSARFQELQAKLYQKYVAIPDIWQVDMLHAP